MLMTTCYWMPYVRYMANWPTIKLKVASIMTASQSFLRYERLKSFIK